MRVVFFGNSESAFSNRHWKALTAAPCDVVAVVDTPPAKRASTNTARPSGNFVAEARERGVAAFEPLSPNAPDFVTTLRELAPDLLMAVGYTNLLKTEILAAPRLVAANFHASLLPAYRGKHPLYWALQNGEREAGLTVHVMDASLDTGDILYQVRVPVAPGDTVASLYERVMERSGPLVLRLVVDATAGRLVRAPQPSEGASYYGAIKE